MSVYFYYNSRGKLKLKPDKRKAINALMDAAIAKKSKEIAEKAAEKARKISELNFKKEQGRKARLSLRAEIHSAYLERARLKRQAIRDADREGFRALQRFQYHNNLEKYRAKALRAQHIRRARVSSASIVALPSDYEMMLLKKQKGRCLDCGIVFEKTPEGKYARFNRSQYPTGYTVAHLNPLNGRDVKGSNFIENLALQCMPCNARQHTKTHPKATLSLFDQVVVIPEG